jgi:hypothetical protein
MSEIAVKDAGEFIEGSFRSIEITSGVKAMVGKLKSDPLGSVVIEKYLFDNEKFSTAEAEKWVDEHKRHSEVETRSCEGNFRISIDDKVVTLRGTAVPYNKLSSNPIAGYPPELKERILPGAFKRSVESGANIFMFWNHEQKYVLGRTSKGTLRLTEDGGGIQFENNPPDAQWVKDLIPSIRRGDIANMSFGFQNDVAPTWTKEDGINVINVRAATLTEISIVTHPVYESTSVFSRGSGFMVVDGVVLDCISEEKAAEQVKEEEERFKKLDDQFESFKKMLL